MPCTDVHQMASYNMYVKDEKGLQTCFDILRTIPGITHVTKEHRNDFMPPCIEFTTEVYTDYGLYNVLKDKHMFDNEQYPVVLLRKLHRQKVLL